MAYIKEDLVKDVSKKTGLTQQQTRDTIDAVFETIKDKLFFGLDVHLKNFINFTLVVQKAHTRVNPQTGKDIKVPKRYRVKMVLSKKFTDKVYSKTVY